MDDNQVIAFCSSIILIASLKVKEVKNKKVKNKKGRRTRGPDREWVKRKERGAMKTLVNELRLEDIHSYRNYMRMDEDSFVFLLNLIKEDVKKQNTVMRQAISPEERLTITLKFYATGMTFRELFYIFRVGERTISYIVKQVTKTLIQKLSYTFQLPQEPSDWKEIADQYWSQCNLPNCIGAIDGKHVVMRKPANSGSHYHNYKGTESIVLMAIVDSNLLFRYIDVGVNGRISDGGVWDKCRLNQLLQQKKLNIPEDNFLPQSGLKMPYYFVADQAFPLTENTMKPYPEKSITAAQRVCNYRLSRGRRCVECAFGVLSTRFRIYLTSILLNPSFVQDVVIATCSLHNFLARRSPHYTQLDKPPNMNKTCLRALTPNNARNSCNLAKEARNRLAHYFLTEAGRVDWQYKYANLT